jgi:hypothetical protein
VNALGHFLTVAMVLALIAAACVHTYYAERGGR